MKETVRNEHRLPCCHCMYKDDRKWILIAIFALEFSALCLTAMFIILSRRLSELQALINQ